MKRSGLGKGIAALIPEAPALRPGTVIELAVGEIRPNPLQPRRSFTRESLDTLAASIKEHGLLQPVVVSRAPEGGYTLIAGERRWRAAQRAGLARIPVVIREPATDADQLALALIENLQREDLTPIEEARAYHHLRSELGLSQEAIAERVGKERSTVANALRLLQLPLAIQEQVDAGALSAGHGRSLAGVGSRAVQEELAARCVREGWSVRELERRLRPARPGVPRAVDADTAAAADRLATALGARVEIRRRRRGGEIKVRFANEEELIRIYKLLVRGER
ncbi:MAG: ParB/RepB/Spo0J family partition protein [Acidobacteriota bacterium]